MASSKSEPAKAARGGCCWGLCNRRERLSLNWKGRVVVLGLVVCLGLVFVHTIHPFLAPVRPVKGGVLVTEGWNPDHILQAAMGEFTNGGYSKLYLTGGPLELGAPLSEYGSFAELGAASIARMGFDTNRLQAVPAPKVPQDRTYTTAVALKRWFEVNGGVPAKMTVLTGGTHARRSWILYKKVMGKGTEVGVIAVPEGDYDPEHWWRTSLGVRGVIDETVAYVYARFFFWP